MASKKVLLFGLGFFQRILLKAVSNDRPCIVVDINGDLVERANEEFNNVTAIEGEASSIVTWKKINLEDVSHIVSSLQDYDVVLEICRIARNVYNLQVPIIVLLNNNDKKEELNQFDVQVVNPLTIATESILNIIQKNYAKPNNIGLGQGEIVEVIIRRRSHIVGRKMRFLAPARWKVAACYREGNLLIPDGDFKLQLGDRVVLIGDPKVVENIVNILMVGKPEFPLQYGQVFAVLADNLSSSDTLEMDYFYNHIQSNKFLWYETEKYEKTKNKSVECLGDTDCEYGGKLKNFRSAAFLHDIGTLAISGTTGLGLFYGKLRYFFKKLKNPLLVTRGKYPYKEVVVLLNGNIPDRLIETGSEVAAHFKINCRCIFVIPPGALKTKKDEKDLQTRKTLVREFENLSRTKIPLHVYEGNPVNKILEDIVESPDSLICLSANSSDPISFLSPHANFIIASRCDNSVLILPDESTNG